MRFLIALWGSKFLMLINKIKGQERDDFPGLLAFKIDPDFLKKVAKPRDVVVVSGTNGKTTTSTFINNYFAQKKGLKTSYNDWGANAHAGFCVNFLRGVNIFNKCKTDMSVIEADEMTLDFSLPRMKPNYTVVTNICKDSLRRNAHPEYIFSHMDRAIRTAKPLAILNANDPISSQLGAGSDVERVFFSMEDPDLKPYDNKSKDIRICPYCGADIQYNYRIYRHIGDFYCPKCGFKTPEAKYVASNVNLKARTMDVTDGGVTMTYNLPSDTIYFTSNILAAIAMLREYGESREDIRDFFRTQQLPDIRQSCVEYGGTEYYTYCAKGQNISAASVAFEQLANDPTDKVIVLCVDEVQDKNHPLETVSWLYESDYELLARPNIRKVVCTGHMGLAHKLRLLLAGVPEDRILWAENDEDIPAAAYTEGVDGVYILFETDNVTKSKNWRDAIVAYAKSLKGDAAAADGKEVK